MKNPPARSDLKRKVHQAILMKAAVPVGDLRKEMQVHCLAFVPLSDVCVLALRSLWLPICLPCSTLVRMLVMMCPSRVSIIGSCSPLMRLSQVPCPRPSEPHICVPRPCGPSAADSTSHKCYFLSCIVVMSMYDLKYLIRLELVQRLMGELEAPFPTYKTQYCIINFVPSAHRGVWMVIGVPRAARHAEGARAG